MLKKTIKYKDLDGNPLEEDFWFNISKAELAEMEISSRHGESGGMEEYLTVVIATEDGAEIIKFFKTVLKMSYGVRSEDGKRFIKNDDVWNDFYQSDAYSELFMELVTDAEAGVLFFNGILPEDLSKKAIQDAELPEPKKKSPKDMSTEELREAYTERMREIADGAK